MQENHKKTKKERDKTALNITGRNKTGDKRYFDILMCAFSALLIISNIASSAKIVDCFVSIAGIRLVFDGGTLIFPLSYILGDILT